MSIDDTVIKGKELVFSASFGDYQTKTAFQSDETSIWWSPGDAIKIYYGSASNGDVFTSSHTVEVAKAEFTGTLSAFTGVTGTGDFNYFWAVYPQTAGISCNGSSVVASLAGVQQAKAGSFTTNTNVTIAKSPGLALSFYNTCAWFRFTVTQEGVKTVRFRGNAGEYVAGQFRVSMDENGKPTAPEVIDGEGIQEIVLNAPEGQTLVVGAMYYITLLPQTFQEGFTVTFETESLVGRRSINSSSTYVRSKYNTGTNFDQNVEYTSKLTGNIEFADSNVKSICVANWDANSDGELSYEEAAAVTTIPYGVFSGNTTITSFDEFQYFTNVTSLGYEMDNDEGTTYYGAFSGCTALTSIILPPSLRNISHAAFYRCSSLANITIPSTVARIGMNAFYLCTNLEVIMESATPCTLYKDSNVSQDEPYSFGDYQPGSKVKVIYVPTEESVNTYKNATYWYPYQWIIKWIGERITPSSSIVFADENVKAICVANWDSNNDGELSYEEAAAVTIIGTVFENNSTITTFDEFRFFTNVTALGTIIQSKATGGFQGCTSLTSIILPESITKISGNTFKGCSSLSVIAIPQAVSEMTGTPFDGCSNLQRVEITNLASWCNINFVDQGNPLSYAHHLYMDGYEVTFLTIPEGVTCIGRYAFRGCTGLTNVSIPEGVTEIGAGAFGSCTGLTRVSISESVIKIGSSAFGNCTGLQRVDITNLQAWCGISFSSLSSNPLSQAHHLYIDGSEITSLTIPNGTQYIKPYAFCNCFYITDVTIPGSVNTIGSFAFSECSNLSSVTILEGVTSINESAFENCAFSTVSIPSTVSSIGIHAFYFIENLESFYSYPITPPTLSAGFEARYLFGELINISNLRIYVPADSFELYSSTSSGWGYFKTLLRTIP